MLLLVVLSMAGFAVGQATSDDAAQQTVLRLGAILQVAQDTVTESDTMQCLNVDQQSALQGEVQLLRASLQATDARVAQGLANATIREAALNRSHAKAVAELKARLNTVEQQVAMLLSAGGLAVSSPSPHPSSSISATPSVSTSPSATSTPSYFCAFNQLSQFGAQLECVDGTLVSIVNPSAWFDCQPHGGLLRCPPPIPIMCEGNSTLYPDHQCASTVEGCDDYGGRRYCGPSASRSPTASSSPSASASPSPTVSPSGMCKWLEPTEDAYTLGCLDGTACDVRHDNGWHCCANHLGREQCPVGYTMCTDLCTVDGADHCCMADCTGHGGPLGCACTAPANTTGYGQIVEESLEVGRFNVTAVCAEGYTGNASAECNARAVPGRAPYGLFGCTTRPCRAGNFSTAGSYPCSACGDGSYTDKLIGSTQCTGCPASLHFPGGTTVDYAEAPSYSFPSPPFTVEGWVKLAGQYSDKSMFSYAVRETHNCLLVTANVGLTDTWAHWAFTVDASNAIQHYVDGATSSLPVWPTDVSFCGTTGGHLVLGQEQDSVGGTFDANQAPEVEFDMLTVHASMLSASQLTDLAAGGDVTGTSVWNHWSFDDSANRGLDSGSQGAHMTVHGGSIAQGYAGAYTDSNLLSMCSAVLDS